MTKTQQRAFDKMEKGKEYSAYDLQESLATLEALRKAGLLQKRAVLGCMFSPRTGFKFYKK